MTRVPPNHGGTPSDQVFDLAHTAIVPGTTVVEASAGTGKTYCLTGLVLRLLLEGRVSSLGRLLVVTFTVAATDELVARVRHNLELAHRVFVGDATSDDPLIQHLAEQHGMASGNDRGAAILQQALAELDDLAIFTIHGFAKRVLDERAFESGHPFEQELLEHDEPLLLRAARDFWRKNLYRADTLVTAVVRARKLTPESFLDDLREWRQHPQTTLLPPPENLDTAANTLAASRAELAKLLRSDAVVALRRLVTRARFLRGKELSPDRFERLLDTLHAWVYRADAAGLTAAATLSAEGLSRRLFKQERAAAERQPLARACSAVVDAAEGLQHALRGAFFHQVSERFAAEKRRLGHLTFDDLLERVDAALDDPRRGPALARSLGQHYQAALIDEFQDTDLRQYRVFHRLFSHRPLLLIGDPKQAIYRFRGADVFAYMEARTRAQRRYTLERNWRSTEALVTAINTLFGAGPQPFVFDAIPFVPNRAAGQADATPLTGDGGRALEWRWLAPEPSRRSAERSVQRAVLESLRRLLRGPARLDGRPVEPGDLAILVRTNAQAQALRQTLDDAGIPAILGRAGDVFLSEEMEELERVLAALADPRDSRRVRTAVATRLWGFDDAAVRRLQDDDHAWRKLLDQIADLRGRWLGAGFMPMMRRWIDDERVEQRLLAQSDGERRTTNLLHAVELLHQASHERHLSPRGLLAWLVEERQRHAAGQGSGEGAELRLESDERAVQIVTVHKSKGLEYNIVLCPYLWQGRPVGKNPPVIAHRDGQHRVFDFGGDDFEEHRRLAEAERMAEDLRLAYVALTRARYRCIVFWGNLGRPREAGASALAHLLHPVVCGPVDTATLADPGRLVAERSRAMGEAFERWQPALRRWVETHDEVLGLGDGSSLYGVASPDSADTVAAPRARQFPADAVARLQPWRMASFTSLARSATLAAPETRPAHDHADPSPASPPQETTPVAPVGGLFAFARGARPGQCLHTVFETCDLRQPGSADNQQAIHDALVRFGLHEPASHQRRDRELAEDFDPQAVLQEMLHTVAQSPVPGFGFRLAEVAPSSQLVEWQFHLPLGGFRPPELAHLFADDDPDYARHLTHLDDRGALRGFLTGFVDLAFEHQGRWFLLDWKSNHLGNRAEDYRRPQLDATMRGHHYLLQCHLYTLALHRYLRHRQPGYDYDTHFGGVIYVYLRGLTQPSDSTEPSTTGWWVDRPPRERIDALDLLAQGATPKATSAEEPLHG